MSGTTFTWTGATSTDWNTATNWNTGTVANSPTVTAIVNTGTAIVSGGSTDTVAALNVGPAIVDFGGGGFFGGIGPGFLNVVGAISETGGAIVSGVQGSTLSASGITLDAASAIGGAGNYNDAGALANGGTVRADGSSFGLGSLLVVSATTISGAGSIEVWGGSKLELAAATSESINLVTGLGTPADVQFDSQALNYGGIINLTAGIPLDLFLQNQSVTSATIIGGSTLQIVTTGSGTHNYSITGAGSDSASVTGPNQVTVGPVCFSRGTRIATPEGYVEVERLAPGDEVTSLNGRSEKILWIGRRRLDCRRHPDPLKVWPIRIKAGAFAPNLPERDLLVSPQHAIYDEGVLIPAKYLVNGASVVIEDVNTVEYFHIELPHHDILFAEGLPAESYLENGDRDRFENGDAPMRLHPDFSYTWDARACAGLKITGPEVDRVKAKLAKRAKATAKPRRIKTAA